MIDDLRAASIAEVFFLPAANATTLGIRRSWSSSMADGKLVERGDDHVPIGIKKAVTGMSEMRTMRSSRAHLSMRDTVAVAGGDLSLPQWQWTPIGAMLKLGRRGQGSRLP
jgi:hypothetical protein